LRFAKFFNAVLWRSAEVFASENGELIVYHTCKSRACPRCGYWATKRWIPERLVALPPVPYKGITFSMPVLVDLET
jgi:Transposase zinc-binding domain